MLFAIQVKINAFEVAKSFARQVSAIITNHIENDTIKDYEGRIFG